MESQSTNIEELVQELHREIREKAVQRAASGVAVYESFQEPYDEETIAMIKLLLEAYGSVFVAFKEGLSLLNLVSSSISRSPHVLKVVSDYIQKYDSVAHFLKEAGEKTKKP